MSVVPPAAVLELPSAHSEGYTWRLKKLRVLGKGSFGTAVLAQLLDAPPPHVTSGAAAAAAGCGAPLQQGSHVVVKEINLQNAKPADRARLTKEIHILQAVQHPNVVAYFDSSPTALGVSIVMEFCDGGDVDGLIAAANRREPTKGMTENEVWAVLIQLVMALKCLHFQHRVLHRDLKPHNVFLTRQGVVKVGDFGVSTVLSQSMDMAKTFCGSPYYLAPELCQERPYNGKADLWSLGCVVYEMMAHGERAFAGTTLVAILQNIINVRFTPIHIVCAGPPSPFEAAPPSRAGYSSDLTRVVDLLLRKEPDERASILRLLRLGTLRSRVHTVLPPHLTQTAVYVEQFGHPRDGPVKAFTLPTTPSSTASPVASSPAATWATTTPGEGSTPGATAALHDGATLPPPDASGTAYPTSHTALSTPPRGPDNGTAGGASLAATGGTDDEAYADDFDDIDDAEADAIEARVYATWAVRDGGLGL